MFACHVKAASDFGGPFSRWMELNTGLLCAFKGDSRIKEPEWHLPTPAPRNRAGLLPWLAPTGLAESCPGGWASSLAPGPALQELAILG